jgi:hypothetical protein
VNFRDSVLRTFSLWLLAFWLGGFTFYSAVVIPILHEDLGSALEAGLITQRVTNWLNLVGIVAVGTAWLVLFLTWRPEERSRWSGRIALGLLSATTLGLMALLALHPVLDRRLQEGAMKRFYTWHQAYLWISTVQWAVNLGLIAVWPRPHWTHSRRPEPTTNPPASRENRGSPSGEPPSTRGNAPRHEETNVVS